MCSHGKSYDTTCLPDCTSLRLLGTRVVPSNYAPNYFLIGYVYFYMVYDRQVDILNTQLLGERKLTDWVHTCQQILESACPQYVLLLDYYHIH